MREEALVSNSRVFRNIIYTGTINVKFLEKNRCLHHT